MVNYQQAVPAVQKALAVLDYLNHSAEPPTLTELSRTLQVNRSTLLAILNTLRSAGWLVRDTAARYRLGPAILMLSHASEHTVNDAQEHLREAGGLLAEAERRLAAAVAGLLLPRATASPLAAESGGLHGSELDSFLALPLVASLACLNEDGYPYTVPIWYEWRDAAFWVAPRPGARWLSYLRAHPRISMTISESSPPFRRVLVKGRAEAIEDDQALNGMARRMARRYLGANADSFLAANAPRRTLLLRIAVDKLTSWAGLVAHPRYAAGDHGRARHPA